MENAETSVGKSCPDEVFIRAFCTYHGSGSTEVLGGE